MQWAVEFLDPLFLVSEHGSDCDELSITSRYQDIMSSKSHVFV